MCTRLFRFFRLFFANFDHGAGPGTTIAPSAVTVRLFYATLLCVVLYSVPANASTLTVVWDANPEPDIAGYIVEYGPAAAPFTQSVTVANVTSWTLQNATFGTTYMFRVMAFNSAGQRSDYSDTVSAVAGPTLTPDRTSLAFAAVAGAPAMRTSAQSIRLTQAGAGQLSWTAFSNVSWLQVTPSIGSGSGALTVSLAPGALPPASATAQITINTAGSAVPVAPIPVTLNVMSMGQNQAPFGAVDSPTDNATGVTGSLAMTGWSVDDVEVARVQIFRDAVSGETPGLVYVGDATLVEDARPDVAAAYPTYPESYRAGWGYLLLTNMLPGLGNGTFRLSAFAYDADGHSTLLGTRTVTCTNNSATVPFGAIDTPSPGGTVSGNNYTSFGWVLARSPRRADVPGGGTTTVLIDGTSVGSPSGWSARPDLSALFPASEYAGINNAAAAFGFDTTQLSNGMHTVAWVVIDNEGNAAGIGSRYFRVFNGATSSQTMASMTVASSSVAAPTLEAELAGASIDASPVDARRGYTPDEPLRRYTPAADGRITLQAEELDRIEVATAGATAGYLVSAGAVRSLPVGSSFDPNTGSFIWQPGVGFIGAYDFAFTRRDGGRVVRQDVRVVLNPKGSNRVGPQVVIDYAGDIVAGWAADLDSPLDTGIDVIHVWAYPRNGGDPIFVGQAAYGGKRPDVAAVYGDRFLKSGFGLRVTNLEPGDYTLAVFAWSSANGRWLPARVAPLRVSSK